MSLGVLNNISAIYAENNINSTQTSLSKTLQQLSSGSRINSGSDDAAGLAIANGLAANSTALAQSSQNASNAIGLLQTADGALGEVTKFLVYNARKRQVGGDRADKYFLRTECVAGVQDMRFQELMPDVLHWLGITRIDRLVSMSNLKYAPLVAGGIDVVTRVPIPDELIPPDASVEMDAKKAAGYFSADVPDAAELSIQKGRGLEA